MSRLLLLSFIVIFILASQVGCTTDLSCGKLDDILVNSQYDLLTGNVFYKKGIFDEIDRDLVLPIYEADLTNWNYQEIKNDLINSTNVEVIEEHQFINRCFATIKTDSITSTLTVYNQRIIYKMGMNSCAERAAAILYTHEWNENICCEVVNSLQRDSTCSKIESYLAYLGVNELVRYTVYSLTEKGLELLVQENVCDCGQCGDNFSDMLYIDISFYVEGIPVCKESIDYFKRGYIITGQYGTAISSENDITFLFLNAPINNILTYFQTMGIVSQYDAAIAVADRLNKIVKVTDMYYVIEAINLQWFPIYKDREHEQFLLNPVWTVSVMLNSTSEDLKTDESISRIYIDALTGRELV